MRVLIENYRGWEIYFDSESEDFYTVSNQFDRQSTKKSFASTKKHIDDFIKDNSDFKPFYVENENGTKKLRIVGVRKDGRFYSEDENGKKEQISQYSESDLFLVNEDNVPVFKELSQLKKQEEEIRLKIKETSKKLIKIDLKEVRENLNL